MEPLMYVAQSISPLLASLLIASVWQGLLLTAVVAVALHAARDVSPAVRTRIWTGVLVAVLLLPALALLLRSTNVSGHAELRLAQGWSIDLLGLWALLAAWRGLRLAAGAVRLWHLARHATPVPVEQNVAALLNGPRRAQLCVSTELNRPGVVGFFRPRVLLPMGLLETLSPQELEHVVLHEMEHLRRGDDWWNLLQQISLVILPLNPTLLWLDRRLCRERELACDDSVLAATSARRAYAACLVKLAEESLVRKGLALALSALGSRARESELVGRVRRILAGPERAAASSSVRFAGASLSIAILAMAGLLARSPELVSFDAAPSVMAQAAEPTHGFERNASQGSLVTASATLGRGTAKPSMQNAIFTNAGSMKPASLPTLRVQKKVLARRTYRVFTSTAGSVGPAKRAVPIAGVWSTLPVRAAMDSIDEPSRPASVPAFAASDVSAARVVVAQFEFSQPLFAAVPVRGGWLILQL